MDTNVIAYLFIEGEHTEKARKAFKKDPEWVAPILWRSEFRILLMLYMRRGSMNLETALKRIASAEQLLKGNEYHVKSLHVLELVNESKQSAYDCEFVALAEDLEVPLVTSDAAAVREFGDMVISLKKFAN